MERTENLNFNQTDRVAAIGKALSSEIRIQILEALEEQEHNVNELAELLELPASSTAMHVRVLEEAGLIETELRAAAHLVLVTNEVFSDGIVYDPDTIQYQKQLAKINQVLAAEADEVTEVIYGIPWKLKAKKEEGVEGRWKREKDCMKVLKSHARCTQSFRFHKATGRRKICGMSCASFHGSAQ